MKHRNSHLLVGYWSQLRQQRDVPDQTDIEPRAIKRILSYVFILDASEASQPVYRLAGTSQCDRYGIELKGTHFFERWEPESRATLASLLKQALTFAILFACCRSLPMKTAHWRRLKLCWRHSPLAGPVQRASLGYHRPLASQAHCSGSQLPPSGW